MLRVVASRHFNRVRLSVATVDALLCQPGAEIGSSFRAAFSGLNIHTSPPTIPTVNDTAPSNSEMLTPSLGINPAYPKASPMVASRTPQPAIEIGSIVINITGGTSRKIWLKTTGAAMDRTTHQAMTAVRT